MTKEGTPLWFIKELGRGLPEMGVLFDNDYGSQKRGIVGFRPRLGEEL